jgi:hypothetical protein
MRLSILLALVLAMSVAPARAVEEAPFQTVRKVGDIEIRRYPAIVVVETTVSGDLESAGDTGFRPLFDYIDGQNVRRENIAMTAPVIQQGEKIAMTAPVIQEGGSGRYVVQFVLPARYTLATAPAPTNPAVRLREVPARTVAVVRYSGRWTQSNYDEALARLRAGMAAANLAPKGDPIWARYDPPFLPGFLRRNEIMIEIAAE